MRLRVLALLLFVALALGACNLNPQPLPPEEGASRGQQDASTSSGPPGSFASDANAPPATALGDAGDVYGFGREDAAGTDAARPNEAAGDAAGPDARPEGGQAPQDEPLDAGSSADARANQDADGGE